MNKPILSVIIVTYQSWNVLKHCLDAFRAHPPSLSYELIVVNNADDADALTDFANTTTRPAAAADLKYLQNTGNWGFSSGCNLGASAALGDYLLFLNPDTELNTSGALDIMLEYAQTHPNIGITSCRRIRPNGKPEREITFANPWLSIGLVRAVYKTFNRAQLQAKFPPNADVWQPDWVAGSVVLIKTTLFNTIGRWDEDNFWMYYEDVALCFRVKATGLGVALLRNVSIKHIGGGTSRSDPATTAVSKSEVLASSHVNVQIRARGLNKIALHASIIIDTLLSQALKVLFTLPMFWKPRGHANALVLFATLRYYIDAIIKRSWHSKRLMRTRKK